MERLGKGLTLKLNENGFKIAYLHYTADEHKTEEWAAEMRKSYPSLDIWKQEMELDFTKATGRRVYPDFKSDIHITKLQPIPYRDIWRGWDFGYHHPACVWAQVDANDRLNVLAELMGTETVINNFAQEVKALSKKLFVGYNFKDAGDPAVRARSDKSERTSADILRYHGIRIQTKGTLIKDGINTIRTLLLPRADGFIKLKINESCPILTEGFMGQYQRNDEDEPIKDGYYEHIFDALRYLVVNLYDARKFNTFKPSYPWARKRATALPVPGY